MSCRALGWPKATALVVVLTGLVPPGHSEPPPAAVPDLFQVILEVRDMEGQVAFYRDVLGLPVSYPLETSDLSAQPFVRFETPGASLALHARTGDGPRPAPARLSFMLPDVVSRRKELLAQGVEMGPIRSPAPGVLVTDGRDPERNVFHLETRVDAGGATDEVAAQARAAVDGWLDAYNSREWETFLGYYAEDPRFHFHEKGRTLYASKDEVRAAIQGLYESIDEASFTVEALEVIAVSDRLALATAPYAQELSLPDGTELALSGVMHLVMARGAGGWQLLAGDSVPRE